jgi:hypothetical protein
VKNHLALRPLILLSIVAFAAGCVAPRVDWDSRVGVFDYDQAVHELGQPSKVEPLPDGQTVAVWVSHYSVNGGAADMDSGFYSHSPSLSPPTSGNRESQLRLTFTTNNVLTDWSKN